ncbi:hypothetical protein NHX12_003908 [Muraenolepis orangiensis]|uniref:Piezo-type mechanosensitive ion channel component n=1 Tax=Muraenolepis orangiensis TaxID=630683 RepID=A0A9Q0DVR9_9TELE|nr:hypothetical protein NHX12_003908 [Muraenolepis orangiensis]
MKNKWHLVVDRLTVLFLKFLEYFHKLQLFIWWLLEIHVIKIVSCYIILVAIKEVSLLNSVFLASWAFALPYVQIRPIASSICTVWTCVIIICKMLYQLESITPKSYSKNCSIPEYYQKKDLSEGESVLYKAPVDPANWVGLMKSKPLLEYLRNNLLMLGILAFEVTIYRHQQYFRLRNKLTPPAARIIFHGVTRQHLDHGIVNFVKYFVNYFFYKFGLETCMLLVVNVIGQRMDFYSMLHAFALTAVMYRRRRKAIAEIWPKYCCFLACMITFQFFICIGIPPAACADYPWRFNNTSTDSNVVKWLYVPDFRTKPNPMFLFYDFMLLLCASLQRQVFDDENKAAVRIMAGDNVEICRDLDAATFSVHNPVPDFIHCRSYLDMLKVIMFSYLFWFVLTVLFFTGTTRISVFCMGYLVACFYFLLFGGELLLKPIKKILTYWDILIAYNIFVIAMKNILSILACGYINKLLENYCWLIQLLSLACTIKEYNVMPEQKPARDPSEPPLKTCELPSDEAGIIWDSICFVFLLLQRRVFMSYYFLHVVADIRASQILASRGAELFQATIVKAVRARLDEEHKSMEQLKRQMDRIKMRQQKFKRGKEKMLSMNQESGEGQNPVPPEEEDDGAERTKAKTKKKQWWRPWVDHASMVRTFQRAIGKFASAVLALPKSIIKLPKTILHYVMKAGKFLYHAWITDPKTALKEKNKERRKFWKKYTKGVRNRKSKKEGHVTIEVGDLPEGQDDEEDSKKSDGPDNIIKRMFNIVKFTLVLCQTTVDSFTRWMNDMCQEHNDISTVLRIERCMLTREVKKVQTPRYTAPHHATPHYTTPRHTTPRHTTPHHTTPRHTTLHRATPRHTTLHHATPRHATPRHTTPHHATPRYTTPRHTTPRHTTPRHTTPHHSTPHHSTPHHATPRHATPHHATPRHTTLHHATPRHTTLHHATPHHATPHHATPHHATPRHTTPHHTTPRHTTPRHATPHHTTPHHTTPRHATPRHTTPHHATPRHTTPRHSTPHHTTQRHATPHHTTPHHTTQRHTTPLHTTPRHTTQRHTTPHHTTPHHTTPHHATPLHTTPRHATPRHTTPHHTTQRHTTPHHSTPRHTTPHHTTPHHATPHNATPRHTTPHHATPHHTTPHHTTPHHTPFSNAGNVPSRDSIHVYYQKAMRLNMSRQSSLDLLSEDESGSQRATRGRQRGYRMESQDSLASRDSISSGYTEATMLFSRQSTLDDLDEVILKTSERARPKLRKMYGLDTSNSSGDSGSSLVSSENTQHQAQLWGSLEPEGSLEPGGSLEPERSLEYKGSLEPERSLEYKGSLELERSLEHKGSLELERSLEHKGSLELERSLEHKGSLELERSLEHKGSLEPERSLEHKGSLKLERSLEHKGSLEPERSLEHKGSLEPERSLEHKGSLEPERSLESERSLEPEVSLEPERSQEPEVSLELEGSQEQEGSQDPEASLWVEDRHAREEEEREEDQENRCRQGHPDYTTESEDGAGAHEFSGTQGRSALLYTPDTDASKTSDAEVPPSYSKAVSFDRLEVSDDESDMDRRRTMAMTPDSRSEGSTRSDLVQPSMTTELTASELLLSKMFYDEELDRSEKFYSGQPLVLQLGYALYNMLVAHSEMVCYLVIIINHMLSASCATLVLPITIFMWAMLSVPRPSKRFWMTAIVYTEITIVVKYFFQFGFFHFHHNKLESNKPYHPPNIIGVEKKDGYAHYDLIQLLALFFHRSILKCHGLWDEDDPRRQKREQAAQEMSEGEDNSHERESGRKEKEEAPSVKHERRGSLRSINFDASGDSVQVQMHRPQQKTFQRRKSSSGGSHISQHSALSSARSKRGSTASRSSSRHDGSEASVQKSRKQLIMEKLQEQLIRGKTVAHKRYGTRDRAMNFYLPIRQFFTNLIHPEYSAVTDVYVLMFLAETVDFLIIVFGFAAFGKHSGADITSSLSEDQVPGPFLVMVLIQFGSMVVDRALYLKKTVMGKVVFQAILVFGIHFWMFFILPAVTEKRFSENKVAQMWYFVKCIYFGLSAYQIRCGYPTRVLGNFLTKSYNYANLFLFQGFRLVPFLTELRAVMDWVWTDTSLSLSSWICVEDIYAHIFVLKCWRESEKRYPQPRGQKKKKVVKYGMGGMIVMLLICIVWFPLLFMSLVKSVAGVVNKPLDVSLTITLASFQPIFTMSAQQDQLQNRLDYTFFLESFKGRSDEDACNQWLGTYLAPDLTVAELEGSSNSLWTISPPSRKNLIKMLGTTVPFPITLSWSIQRNLTLGAKAEMATGKLVEYLDVETRDKLMALLNKSSNKSVTIKNFFPRYLRAPSDSEAKPVTQLFKDKLKVNITLSLKGATNSSGETREWWIVNQTEPGVLKKKSNASMYAPGLDLYLFSDQVSPPSLGFLAGYGIMGLYASVVLVIGKFVREFFSGISHTIMFEELPNVDRILKLCTDIFLVRETGELDLEEDMYSKLIFLYRSPETMIKWTREKTE